MAKIQASYETTNQELIISANANSREEAATLGYDDFKIDLFINGKHVSDLTPLLAKTKIFERLIDGEDWERIYS